MYLQPHHVQYYRSVRQFCDLELKQDKPRGSLVVRKRQSRIHEVQVVLSPLAASQRHVLQQLRLDPAMHLGKAEGADNHQQTLLHIMICGPS